MALSADAPAISSVVVGVDGSPAADRALAWAAHAAATRGVPLDVVHAWTAPWLGGLPDAVTLKPIPYERAAQDVLDAAVAAGEGLLTAVEVRAHLVNEHPAAALLAAAGPGAVLVVGSHGRRWVGHQVLGSVSQHCVSHAQGPVVVVPEEWDEERHGRIVVGVDGSPSSYAALHFAAAEAARDGAELDVVHAWQQSELLMPLTQHAAAQRESLEKASRQLLDEMTASIAPDAVTRPGPRSVEVISVEGQPARCLVATARGADLLVVGSRGHGGFAGLLLGSVSQRCLHHAPCPVAVTHG
jgi:nucleotide-binding universal stress UspA family protein